MKYFGALFICLTLSSSCDKVETVSPIPDSYEVEIRIENVSGSNFQSVYVNTSGGEQLYGNIDAGDTTPYFHYDFAYNYAYVQLTINNDTFAIQPIDYVGEQKLAEGHHTYKLNYDSTGLGLTMTVVKD